MDWFFCMVLLKCNMCIFCLSIPPLLPTIQNRLLECISAILSRSHHAMSRQSAALSRGHLATVTPQVPELSGSALVQLSLQTLARFNFKVCRLYFCAHYFLSWQFSLIVHLGLQGHDLLEFARESVVVYLEDEDGATRKDAALCCCKLIANSFLAMSSTQFSPSRINRASGKRRRLVEEVCFWKVSLGIIYITGLSISNYLITQICACKKHPCPNICIKD